MADDWPPPPRAPRPAPPDNRPQHTFAVVRRLTVDIEVLVSAPDEEIAEERAAQIAITGNHDLGHASWSTVQIIRTDRRVPFPRLNAISEDSHGTD